MDKALKNRVITLYKGAPVLSKMYLRLRLALAPFFDLHGRIEEREGRIYDLGCGIGLLSNMLSLAYPGLEVIGIDSSDKVAIARATERKTVSFIKSNILEFDYGNADAFVMMDILHHLSFEEQDLALKKIYGALKPEGKLYIMDVDVKPVLKYGISRLADCASRSKVYHRRIDGIVSLLEDNNYIIEEKTRADRGRVVPHIFVKCRK